MDRLSLLGAAKDRHKLMRCLSQMGVAHIEPITLPSTAEGQPSLALSAGSLAAETAGAAEVVEEAAEAAAIPATSEVDSLPAAWTTSPADLPPSQTERAELDKALSLRLERHRQEHLRLIADHEAWRQRLAPLIDLAKHRLEIAKPMFKTRRAVTEAERLRVDEQRAVIMEQVQAMSANEEALQACKQQIERYESRRHLLAPWKELSLPGGRPDGTTPRGQANTQPFARLAVLFGTFATPEMRQEAVTALREQMPAVASETLYRTEFGMAEMFVVPQDAKEEAERLLQNYHMATFPAETEAEARGDFPQAWLELGEALAELEAQKKGLLEESKRLAQNYPDWEILYDLFLLEEAEAKAQLDIFEMDRAFALRCYIPRKQADQAQKTLQERFRLWISREQVALQADMPVKLENPKLLQPYETVLETFSLPLPGVDRDPTILMGLSYAFFFGMMLSDVGYGLLLAGLCAWLVWGAKVEGNFRKMSLVLFQGSIVSIFFGFLFGGFFGDLIDRVSGIDGAFPALFFNPMDDPIRMMILSIILGVVHIFLAMGFDIYARLKRGEGYEAFTQVAPWYLVIGGLGLLATSLTLAGQPLGAIVAAIGALIILFFNSRAKNPLVRIGSGLFALYGVTGFLSDFLSYTRILALSLATSIIGMVVNLIAMMVGYRGPQVIAFVLILVFGHALNLALSGLSAYVHTTRLQYVEFFGRCLTGGGIAYQPLSLGCGVYTRPAMESLQQSVKPASERA